MKRIFYLLAILLGTIVVGCNPLEDINEELSTIEIPVVGDVVLTLSDEDYEDLDLSFGNFSSTDDAKDDLPAFLIDKYPALGEGSSALVTFKWYNRIDTYSAVIYELDYDEYEPITGDTYGNFSSGGDVYDYLDAKYPTPDEGDFVSLRYDYYSGSTSTLTNGFAYEDGEWTKFTGFTEDQYSAMGEGFPNFSSEDEANTKIPIALIDVYKYSPLSAGDIALAMYELYIGGGDTESYTAAYIFDGEAFSAYENVAEQTLQFGHDGTTWVPDNTIKYTLVPSDYELIVESLSGTYPDATGSMDNYGNFERRSGNSAEWTKTMIAEALGYVLDKLDSSAADGQKYVVTYDVYNGSNGTEDTAVIKTDGVWLLNE